MVKTLGFLSETQGDIIHTPGRVEEYLRIISMEVPMETAEKCS